jgi:hypothetical protein
MRTDRRSARRALCVAVLAMIALPHCSDSDTDAVIFLDPPGNPSPAADNFVDNDPAAFTGDPSLDITGATAASTSSGGWWVSTRMGGTWPPNESFWSYFVATTVVDAGGTPLYRCFLERHEGIRRVFCEVGNVQNLDVREVRGATGGGPIFNFSALPGRARFRVDTGVAPTPNSAISRDLLEGAIGNAVAPPPTGN